ncbi:hypothetical protein DEA98_25400 [Brucella pseudogrignonensis]|nr:hypothetical protein [Brucella pseudogrignonensis]
MDRVATQGIDVGFGMTRTERPGVHFSHLCSMQAVCVLPPWHPPAEKDTVTVRDLENEKFISGGGRPRPDRNRSHLWRA